VERRARGGTLIAGGGYAGSIVARRLGRRGATIVSPENYMLFTPLLPEAASGTLEPRHVVVPLRMMCRHAEFVVGRVTGLDTTGKVATVDAIEGPVEIGYERLVLALGSVSRPLPIPGLAEHGHGFRDLADAIALRNHVLRQLEAADAAATQEEQARHLAFVFVGAGYAGVEALAELADLVRDALRHYPGLKTAPQRWVLVDAAPKILPEIPADLAEFASDKLRGRGIEIRTSTTLDSVTESSATLSDGEVVPCRTCVWTAGVRPHPIVAELGLPLNETGRIVVDAAMQVQGHERIWAIGDAAAVPDPAKKRRTPCPPTCQHAIRQGRRVARNVAAAINGRKPRPFTYRTLGVFVDMGQHDAVATTVGIKWRGPLAWLLARSYHLAMMPGLKRKLRLLTDWNVQLLFGRDASELGGLGHPHKLEQPTGGGTDST